VGARQVIAGGVGTSELADGAVTASKVPDNGLSGADIDESSLAFPSASSQRSAVDGENTITADLGSLGTVALSCLADAQQARVSVLAPPADTTATNIAAELNAQSSGSAVAGARRGPGGDSVVLDTVASPDADHGFSGKVTVARVGETSQHAIVEIAGATRLGGGSTCWLDLQVMR
jgi:hypothetical protein